MKQCELNLKKECNNCRECDICDLDAKKICDNCMKCVIGDNDFITVEIDKIIEDEKEAEKYIK